MPPRSAPMWMSWAVGGGGNSLTCSSVSRSFFYTSLQIIYTPARSSDPMIPLRARSGWVSTIGVLSGLMLTLAGCASLAPDQTDKPVSTVSAASLSSEDDDWSQLKAQMRIDLNRYN